MPVSVAANWFVARVLDALRLAVGVVLALLVAAVGAAAGPQAGFDPGPPLLFAVAVGATVGGLRGGIAAAAVAIVTALLYHSQPGVVGSPGNAARVMLLVSAVGGTAWLVGTLSDALRQLRSRAGERRRTAERLQDFAAAVADAQDDQVAETIVRQGAALVGADMA
ncbi:MAG: hypothetical protein M3N29_08545, partial [Chloroflexota bacterium]|nr:hypothetical protein [Chloroflexota bacterium]